MRGIPYPHYKPKLRKTIVARSVLWLVDWVSLLMNVWNVILNVIMSLLCAAKSQTCQILSHLTIWDPGPCVVNGAVFGSNILNRMSYVASSLCTFDTCSVNTNPAPHYNSPYCRCGTACLCP